jgi:peroxiredoxin
VSAANSSADAVVPGAPGDNTTMTDVVHLYDQAGFTSSWEITATAQLRCGTCEREMSPSAVSMHSFRRVEGASDPDDMAAVLALTCPLCSAHGTLVIMYGPQMSAEESDVLGALRDQRADDVVAPHAVPDETALTEPVSTPPRIGDPAPDFAMPSSTGHVLDLDAFLGKVPIVMAFGGDLESGVGEAVDAELAWFGGRRAQALVIARCNPDEVEHTRSSGRFRVPVLADPDGDLEVRYLGDKPDLPATVIVSIDGDVFCRIDGGSPTAHVARVKEAVALHLF